MIAFWAIIEGLKYLEASIGGLLGLLEIVFSILFGILIFHEGLTLRSTMGAMIVFAAAALPHLVDLRSSKK
jgi:drug/metabolite transporter (DMT)-like permease